MSIADEKGGYFCEVTMSVVLHDDRGGGAFIIIVNDDDIRSKILSIDDFLCKFAGASFYQKDAFGSRILAQNRGLVRCTAKF